MKTLVIAASIAAAAATAVALACPLAETETVAKSTPVVQSPGKGTAGIEVNYRLRGKPTIGVRLLLDVELEARGQATLAVDINAAPELGLPARRLQREAGSGDTLTLELTPQAEGRFYVNIIARNDGNGLARVVSVPIQVGAVHAKASKAIATPGGELVVRLPAAE